jgi:hypothetical protein
MPASHVRSDPKLAGSLVAGRRQGAVVALAARESVMAARRAFLLLLVLVRDTQADRALGLMSRDQMGRVVALAASHADVRARAVVDGGIRAEAGGRARGGAAARVRLWRWRAGGFVVALAARQAAVAGAATLGLARCGALSAARSRSVGAGGFRRTQMRVRR